MNLSRRLSLLVASLYLILAWCYLSAFLIYKLTIFLTLPLACIWFSDELGEYSGHFSGSRQPITEKTPGPIVAIAGWMLLFLPAVMAIIEALGTRPPQH